ncbi:MULTISPECIES: hypothetical protein [unclassified Myroides]|uniref:hypothetical protein n=1 Tax=unclassified Myroides TaxID=2642485 RepID=UPI003D2F6495
MKIYSFLGISVLVGAFASCQTQGEMVQQRGSYAEEYMTSVASYQDTVNPQLYYHTDKKQTIVSRDTIEKIKKSDAN